MYHDKQNNPNELLKKIQVIISDPVQFKNFVRKNQKELQLWGLFLILIFIIYHVISDGDFSFFLTLSGLVQMFGFALITYRIFASQSIAGLSLNSMICFAISFFSRLCSILFYEGYIPYDSSGNWFYQFVEVLSFLFSLTVLYFSFFKYSQSYNWDLDNIKFYYLLPPTLILSIMFHPGLNNYWPADVAWTFGLYLETVAMFPQIYLFTKKGGEIESFTSHYVASQGFCRLLSFIFWVFTYEELNAHSSESSLAVAPNLVGYGVFIAQLVQLVLMGDFLFIYIKSKMMGVQMTLPTHIV